MSEENLEFMVRQYLDKIAYSMNERFNETRREMKTDVAELDSQLLEAVNRINRRLDGIEERLAKLEENSAWNLLVEQAKKLDITPERLLKRAITEYMKKDGKRVK